MKNLILLVLLFNVALANDQFCDEDVFNSEIALPNCLKKEFVPDRQTTFSNFCQKCGIPFNKRYTGQVPKIDLQKKFFEIAEQEFKKSITNNLVDAVKIGSLPGNNTNFQKSILSCKMKSIRDFEKDCNSPKGLAFLKNSPLFNNLEKEIKNELATLLNESAGFKANPALLNRVNPSCFIPEKQLLYLNSSTLEETITDDLVIALQKLDPKKYTSMEDFFNSDEFTENYSGSAGDFRDSVANHPFLNEYFKSPESVISFFKKLKIPISVNDFRKHLYSKESGENIDQNLAKSCDNAFKGFKKVVCSKEFEEGKINLDPVANFEKLGLKQFESTPEKLANSDKLIEKNLEFSKYCSLEGSDNELSLFSQTKEISSGLPGSVKNIPYKDFVMNKHNNEIGMLNENLCKKTPENCKDETFTCKLVRKFHQMQDKNSVDYKLSNSFSEEAKNLLRSMLGDTSITDPKTREILVANGIIPKDDGSFVKQPEIPERQPDYFANAAKNPPPTQITQVTSQQQAQKPERISAPAPFNDQGYTNQMNPDSTPDYNMPDFSDITRDNEELKEIQDEIRRRLTDVPPGQRPTNVQARKAIRETMASQGRTITPAQEEAFATQMVAPQTVSLPQLNRDLAAAAAVSENRARASNGDTMAEKWKKGQMNTALMGMAGAQGTSTDAIIAKANASQEKPLQTVALNIAEDPRVTLSDVFNNKLSQNDSETQLLKVLLKSKNNFVLQLKSMNFKVIFDEKQNFNILLESGNKKEAERIRPQLEMFLKKLRA